MKRIINYNVFGGDPNEIKENEILVIKNNNLGGVLAIQQRINGELQNVFTHVPLPAKFSNLANSNTAVALPATITSVDIDNLCSLMPYIDNNVSIGYNILPVNTCAYWQQETVNTNIVRTIEYHTISGSLIIEATYTKGVYVSGTYTKV